MMTPYNNPNKSPLRNPFAPALFSETRTLKLLPQTLGSWNMIALLVTTMYLVPNATRIGSGGAASLLYIALAGSTFFFPSLIVAAQLGHMFPHTGAIYNWTQRAIGSYWSLFSAFCTWLPGIFMVNTIAYLFIVYALHLLGWTLPSLLELGGAISVILLLAGLASIQHIYKQQMFITTAILLLIISTALTILAAVCWLIQGNHSTTTLTHWSDWSLQPESLSLFGMLVFAFTGVHRPLHLAGEFKGRRVIQHHLFWGGAFVLLLYLINMGTTLIIVGQQASTDLLAPVNIVTKTLGDPFGTIATIGWLGSFFAALLAYNTLFSRLLFVAGLDHRLPAKFGTVNKQHAPTFAILFQTSVSVAFTFVLFSIAPLITGNIQTAIWSMEIYTLLQATTALLWILTTLFLFIDLLNCYLHDRQSFYYRCIFPIPLLFSCIILGLGSSLLAIVSILCFSWTPLIPNLNWTYLVGCLTLFTLIVATFGSMLARSEATWQDICYRLMDTEQRKAQSKKIPSPIPQHNHKLPRTKE
jgi:glutamate:GABA antiporter